MTDGAKTSLATLGQIVALLVVGLGAAGAARLHKIGIAVGCTAYVLLAVAIMLVSALAFAGTAARIPVGRTVPLPPAP